ncbi:Uncharacterised protein [Vibrio cholerae]|nr:Uncharacterised protein [Vibrio cholerae]
MGEIQTLNEQHSVCSIPPHDSVRKRRFWFAHAKSPSKRNRTSCYGSTTHGAPCRNGTA